MKIKFLDKPVLLGTYIYVLNVKQNNILVIITEFWQLGVNCRSIIGTRTVLRYDVPLSCLEFHSKKFGVVKKLVTKRHCRNCKQDQQWCHERCPSDGRMPASAASPRHFKLSMLVFIGQCVSPSYRKLGNHALTCL